MALAAVALASAAGNTFHRLAVAVDIQVASGAGHTFHQLASAAALASFQAASAAVGTFQVADTACQSQRVVASS